MKVANIACGLFLRSEFKISLAVLLLTHDHFIRTIGEIIGHPLGIQWQIALLFLIAKTEGRFFPASSKANHKFFCDIRA